VPGGRRITREYLDVVALVAARWDGLRLEQRMDRWAEQTQDALQSDERREVSVELALADREITCEFIRGRASALLEALEPR